MDFGVNLDNLDELAQLIEFLKTIGKNVDYNNQDKLNEFHEQLLNWPNLNTVGIIYESYNDYPDSLVHLLTMLVYDINGSKYKKETYKLENIELLMKMIMDKGLQYIEVEGYYEEGGYYELIIPIFKLYEKTGSKVVLDFILYNMTKYADENFFIDELYKWRNKPIFKEIVKRLDQETWDINTKTINDDLVKEMNLIRNRILLPIQVVDTALGLRQLNLPSNVVENIASHAYDTTGFSLYQLMSMIAPINENKSKIWMKAGDENGFNDFE